MEKNHFIKQIRKEAGASSNYTLSEYTQWMIYIEHPLLRKANQTVRHNKRFFFINMNMYVY